MGVALIDARGGLHLDTLVSSGSVPVYDGDGLANVRVAARNREWGNDTPIEFLVQIWPAEGDPEQVFPASAMPEPYEPDPRFISDRLVSFAPTPPEVAAQIPEPGERPRRAHPSPISVEYTFAHLHLAPYRANPYDADTGDFLHVTPSGLLRISDGRPTVGGGRTADVYVEVSQDGDPGTVPDVGYGQAWEVSGQVVVPASWGLVLEGGLDGLNLPVYQRLGGMANVRVFARHLRQDYRWPGGRSPRRTHPRVGDRSRWARAGLAHRAARAPRVYPC